MRANRLITVMAAALLAMGLSAPALLAQTMTFRPVPPESVAAATDAAKAEAGRMRDEARREVDAAKVRIRQGIQTSSGPGGVTIQFDDSVADSDGATPAPPAPPRPPRSTTGEIVRLGSDITVESGQEVQGDVVAIGGDVRVEGRVTGSVTAMGGDVNLGSESRVDGDVVCMGGTLREDPGASVGGQRVTAAPKMPGARLFLPMLAAVGTGFEVAAQLLKLLLWAGVAWLIVKLAPGRTEAALTTIRREAGASFAVGLALWALIIPSVIALALVIALLCITIIGIPLAAAVAVGYALFFIVAAVWGAVVGYALLGGELHQRNRHSAATLAQAAIWGVAAVMGLRIVGSLFHIVPMFGFVGGLVKFVAAALTVLLATLGAGALVRSEYQRRTVQDWWSRSRSGFPGQRRGDMPPPPPPTPEPGAPPQAL